MVLTGNRVFVCGVGMTKVSSQVLVNALKWKKGGHDGFKRSLESKHSIRLPWLFIAQEGRDDIKGVLQMQNKRK